MYNVKDVLAWFCCLRTNRELISLAFKISMLLSILICLYFLLLPPSRNEFFRRGEISSRFILALLSLLSMLRPQFCLFRLRLCVDRIIDISKAAIWTCFMTNGRGKGCEWGLDTTRMSALLHFIYGLVNGEILIMGVYQINQSIYFETTNHHAC